MLNVVTIMAIACLVSFSALSYVSFRVFSSPDDMDREILASECCTSQWQKMQCRCGGMGKKTFSGFSGRLINGSKVPEGSLSFIVVIFYVKNWTNDKGKEIRSFVPLCTGSIISRTYILTASICVETVESGAKLMAGGGRNHKLREIFKGGIRVLKKTGIFDDRRKVKLKDENGNEFQSFVNDLALVEVTTKFDFGQQTGIYPACILDKEISEFDEVLIAGYGQKSRVYVVPDEFKKRPKRQSMDIVVGDQQTLLMVPMKHLIDDNLLMCNDVGTTSCFKNAISAPCLADSGAPVLWWDEEIDNYVIIGVVNSLGEVRKDDNMFICEQGGIVRATNVFSAMEWYRSIGSDSDRCYRPD